MNTRTNAGFVFLFYRLFKLKNTLQKDTKAGKFQEQLAEDSMMTNDSLVTDGSCYFKADGFSAGPCSGTGGTAGTGLPC